MNDLSFSSLPLQREILSSIEAMGFSSMTEIQAQSLGPILQKKDLIAQAKTGSGKTATFAIGILSKIDVTRHQVQSLVLCPTRELADQVAKEIKNLARFMPKVKIVTLCGGKPLRTQLTALQPSPHIIVGTPGRILDHMQRRTIHFKHVHTLVLDEADRMLDMGFSEDIKSIIKEVPKNRQTLLFSATFPENIQKISQSIQSNPVRVKVESTHSHSHIEQIFYQVPDQERLSLLKNLIKHYSAPSTLVFCTTKLQVEEVVSELHRMSLKALAFHGGYEQRERDEILVRFSNKSCPILVATDVASRGLDIKDLPLVINFQIPRDPEVYVHRIGRTGRAGNSGVAVSLHTAREKRKVTEIEEYQKIKIKIGQLSDLSNPREPMKAAPSVAVMHTIKIAGGRKNKLCKGDILGALTAGGSSISAKHVGKIDLFDFHSCVAIDASISEQAVQLLGSKPIKGRSFKALIMN